MEIKKYKDSEWFYHYYNNNTGQMDHGLLNSWYDIGVGYSYHNNRKGFCLRIIHRL